MTYVIDEKNMTKAKRLVAMAEDAKNEKNDNKFLLRAEQFLEEGVEWLADVVQKKNKI